MIGQASNPMLEQAEQGIQSKVPQELQAGFEKVIHAGLTIIYSPKLSQQLTARLAASTDPVREAGEGAARLISNLYQQSGKKLPVALVVPAAMVFAFEYLDLVAKAGKAEITPELIASATQAVADAVLPLMGITKDKLAQLIAQSKQGGAQAPAAGAPTAPVPAPSAGIIGKAQAGA